MTIEENLKQYRFKTDINPVIPASAEAYKVDLSHDATINVNDLLKVNEGFDVEPEYDKSGHYVGKRVSYDPSTKDGTDSTHSGALMTHIRVPDIKLKSDLINAYSIFKRIQHSDKFVTDGNPLLYALKNENSCRFKSKADREAVWSDIRSHLKVFLDKWYSALSPARCTTITTPSGSTFGNLFVKVIKEVASANGNEMVVNDAPLGKMSVDDFQNEVVEDAGSDFNKWIYSLDKSEQDLYFGLLQQYLKEMRQSHSGVFSIRMIKNKTLHDNISHFMKIIDKQCEHINDEHILLVDDMLSSGKTVIDACKTLCDTYSPKSVTVLTLFSRSYQY